MNRNKNKPASTKDEALSNPILRSRAPWGVHVTDLVIAIIGSVIATMGSGIVSAILYFFSPSPFMVVFSVLGGVFTGATIILCTAMKLEQRQIRQRQLEIEALKERDRAFFESLEKNILSLLAGERRNDRHVSNF